MERYHKAEECIHPYKYGCKGCEYNQVPELFDGGCTLLYRNMNRLRELEKVGRAEKANSLLDKYEREDYIAYKYCTGDKRYIHRVIASKWYRGFLTELDKAEAVGGGQKLIGSRCNTASKAYKKPRKNEEGLPIELL